MLRRLSSMRLYYSECIISYFILFWFIYGVKYQNIFGVDDGNL